MLELSGVFGARPLLSGAGQSLIGELKAEEPSSVRQLDVVLVDRGPPGRLVRHTSRGYKPAGPKTIAHGLARLDGFIGGWALRSADMRLP